MSSYFKVDEDRSETYVASEAGTYEVNATIATTDLAIDATAIPEGSAFFVNGTVSSSNGPTVVIGQTEVTYDQRLIFKISEKGFFLSENGAGLEALAGGVDVENIGTVRTSGVAFDLRGNFNTLTNNGADIRQDPDDPDTVIHYSGSIVSEAGIAIRSAGTKDALYNQNGASIMAQSTAILMTGSTVSIRNTDHATIESLAGTAIMFEKAAYLYSTSTIKAYGDAIVAKGAATTFDFEGEGSVLSSSGRGIVASGARFNLTTKSELSTITAQDEAIWLSGKNAIVTNNTTISSQDAAAISTSGKAAIITNRSTIEGAAFGILSTGDKATITNAGAILSDGIGISVRGDATLVTSKLHLTADVALRVEGNGTVVTNDNEIVGLSATRAAIEIVSAGKTTVVNEGAIHAASGLVIVAGKGRENVTNTGSLYGDVKLGGGDDVFTTLTGEVGGRVHGGGGNDLYVTGIALSIVEKKGGGIDTVQSKFTNTLAANIENLELLGKGTMDATGNRLANTLQGNRGDNQLTGLGGRDIFVFEKGFGRDIVTDFHHRQDRIDVSSYAGIDRFADLDGRIAQSGDDVVISFSRHDVLTLFDVDRSDLSARDFLF